MAELVVTTGTRFTDIDALACVIAYREIPETKPLAVIPGPLNQSVTQDIRSWNLGYLTSIHKGDFDFVIVDVSEESQLASFVDTKRVIEIYDHHFGFEKQWQQKLGDKAKIEAIGACATLIWEEFKKRNPKKQISTLSANLLYTAIVSNTLNFHSSLTTARDKKAFEELTPFINLPKDWIVQYYLAQEVVIYTDPVKAVKEDTKIQNIRGINCAVGQIELWNSRDFLKEHQDKIESALKSFNTETWFLTSPCISEARSYFYTKSKAIKDLLSQVMAIDFFGTNIGVAKRLWLRKEVLEKIQ